MKVKILFITLLIISVFTAACSIWPSEKFDSKVEQENATKVLKRFLTSFEDREKLAEANTRDEANSIAWEKLEKKNKDALSKNLADRDKKKLLYLVTSNKAEDLSNGEIQSNILFTHATKIKNTSLNETEETFTFDIERSGFDHKFITLEKQEGVWRIIKVQDSE